MEQGKEMSENMTLVSMVNDIQPFEGPYSIMVPLVVTTVVLSITTTSPPHLLRESKRGAREIPLWFQECHQQPCLNSLLRTGTFSLPLYLLFFFPRLNT